MSTTLIRRACAALVLAAIGIVGTAGGAGAAVTGATASAHHTPAAATAPLADGQPAAPAASSQGEFTTLAAVEFDSVLTTALYSAALVSKAAFLQTCAVTPPLWRSACSTVANWVFPELLRLGWPNGRCLEVFTRWGYPPVGVRYKNC
jgi:hypothetical protein